MLFLSILLGEETHGKEDVWGFVDWRGEMAVTLGPDYRIWLVGGEEGGGFLLSCLAL